MIIFALNQRIIGIELHELNNMNLTFLNSKKYTTVDLDDSKLNLMVFF